MTNEQNRNRKRRAQIGTERREGGSTRSHLLQAIFENSLDAILVANDEARYVDVNPAACALTGYSRDELLQLSVWELTPETNREEGLAAWRDFMAAGELEGEYTIQRKDGAVLDTEFRAVANIAPGRHLSVMHDVSERRRREEEVRETNERLRAIIEASPAAVVVLSLEGQVTLWSPAAESMFGWEADEVVGRAYPTAGPPELAEEFRENLRQAAAGESITGLETRRQRKDGSLIDVSMNVSPVYDRSGEVTAVLGLIIDITGRKEAERELQASEARYRRLVETAHDLIWSVDEVGTITFINQAARRIYGREPDEMIGRPYTDFLADEENAALAEIWEEMAADEDQIINYETWVLHRDGSEVLLNANAVLLRDREGNAVGAMGTSQDITERKAMEKELSKYARRLETLHSLAQAILAIQSPEKTAETAIRFLTRLVDADRISAGLFSADHSSTRTLAVYSKGETRLGQGEIFDLDPHKAMIEHLKRGETHMIEDLAAPQVTDPILGRLRDEGLRTYMTIPMLSRGVLVGTLSIASAEPGAFSAREEAIMHEVANQVAIAIRQARLLEEERKQRRLAEALQEAARALSATLDVETIWDRVMEHIGELVPYDSATVMAVDGDRVRMTRMRGYQEVGGEELARRVANMTLRIEETANLQQMVETGRAMVIPDTVADRNWETQPGIPHIRSWVGAPIQMQGITVAFFSVDKVVPNFYGPEHARILEAFAGHVSLALQNAHLFAAEQEAREQLSRLASYLQKAREDERARIAREIHDEFAQSLTALIMDVAWLTSRLSPAEPALRDKLRQMQALIAGSIKTTRRIATELRPGVLDDLGLVAALEWQAQEFTRRYGIDCELDLDQEELALTSGAATACFRICQEALTNVARHAEANEVYIRLEQRSDEIVLSVRDNGRGIREEEIHDSNSLGLTGMIERAHSFGGELTISNTEGQGTTIKARLPRADGGGSST